MPIFHSVLDIIGVLNEQDDYSKTRNYWKYLKTKLKKENNELVSATNQLKLQAPDGKLRLTDVLDNEGIMLLARNFPNNKAADFLDWFTYSDNTIDGQSRKKAYTLFESELINSITEGSVKGLQQIHAFANSTSKCKITKCFCKNTPLVLRNSISFLVSH